MAGEEVSPRTDSGANLQEERSLEQGESENEEWRSKNKGREHESARSCSEEEA